MIDCIEKQQQKQLENYHHHQVLNADISQQSGAHQHALLTMYPQQQSQQSLVEMPNQHQHHQSGNELIGYYFGSISRETAEWILKTHGNQMDGAYLLRSSGPNDDFVLSLMVSVGFVIASNQSASTTVHSGNSNANLEVLHYKIVETEDSFVALHGQVGDEKFATIDELIDKAQGVATKPRWPIHRQSLESQILPPTYWGLTVDQVRLAILVKAKQWGFPLLSSLFQQAPQQQDKQTPSFGFNPTAIQQQISVNNNNNNNGLISATDGVNNSGARNVTTLNNETIRTLIYKSLHEFQPWFHGKISRDEAERRIEEGNLRDGRFLVRERDNYSYAMCISHKKTTKHYRIDVLPTGELAIQDGRKFTSLMALVSHYTIMSDGLWCALTEPCPRPIQVKNGFNRSSLPSNNSNNGSLASNSQIRIQPNQYNNSLMNQNLYCVPLIINNNNMHHNIMPTGLINNLTVHENKMNDSQVNNNTNRHNHNTILSTSTSQTDTSTGKGCGQSSLICSHQGGVTSIKTPIKEWLQTINHKWSQLITSKNQHQSLNSFLFGNQNPLNNHCRHNHRGGQHHINHRRKCKNGHTSCGCIQQMNEAIHRTSVMTLHDNAAGINNNNNQHLTKLNQDANMTKVHNCYTTNLCPAIKDQRTNGLMIPKPHLVIQSNSLSNGDHQQSCNLTTSSLLNYLPQNSGFTLNNQSFIGSPLFAVNQAHFNKNQANNGSGSSNSGSGNNNNVEEEKLISPAQSISANLNTMYNLNTDIYGSETSTAVMNDNPLPATSSSSSSGTRGLNAGSNLPQTHNSMINPANVTTITNNDQLITSQLAGTSHAGPILCGQHAGPAYRYTNCNDENSFKPCFHRPLPGYRAADDSQLITPSTQLAGPAAMTKFVQFQDGQCLRTHRDTRSIQMAYLLSRQTPSNNNSQNLSRNNQVPLRELNIQQEKNNTQFYSTMTMKNNSTKNIGQCSTTNISKNIMQANEIKSLIHHRPLSNHNHHQSLLQSEPQENNASLACKDIDLMDCGEDDEFEFRYDPKLIKSSSIETLCGVGTEEEPMDNLAKYKSNAELMMSLQSCWSANQQQQHNILSPIPTTTSVNNCNFQPEDNSQNVNKQNGQASILSSLIDENAQSKEQLDHMKKKHDLDEFATAIFLELRASLQAQVDLKNKRSGFGLRNLEKPDNQTQQDSSQERSIGEPVVEANPLELINEFDTLISNNR